LKFVTERTEWEVCYLNSHRQNEWKGESYWYQK